MGHMAPMAPDAGRGKGPQASGLIGIDMRVGRCQVDIRERLAAEQVANRLFRLNLPEMERGDGDGKRIDAAVASHAARRCAAVAGADWRRWCEAAAGSGSGTAPA